MINQNRFSFLLITYFEKCKAQIKTCLNSWASLRFRNLSKGFLHCSSSGNWKKALYRALHGLWSIRECCICWLFSCHIPFSIIEFPFHLEKNLNFQRYNFLIGIQDLCRIPRNYLNSKINLSLRCACYFTRRQCVKALRILSTPCISKRNKFLSSLYATWNKHHMHAIKVISKTYFQPYLRTFNLQEL